MADVFISFSDRDLAAAQVVQQQLLDRGTSVFLSKSSLEPGADWSEKVKQAIQQANLVLVLASRAAIQSTWVQQEIGIAIGAKRKIIPIIWDMPAADLPGWLSRYQALDLAGRTPVQVTQDFAQISKQLELEKFLALGAIGALVAAIVKLG
jgi:hypothetical protein